MQSDLPSVFDIHDGEDMRPEYAVPGTLYTIRRVARFRYVPAVNGVTDTELAAVIDDKMRDRKMRAELMHELGKLVLEHAEKDCVVRGIYR